MSFSTMYSDAFMTEVPPPTNPVRRINNALRGLDKARVYDELLSTESTHGVYVCNATKSDLIRYVKSENYVFKSRTMMWKEGKIYVVEPLGRIHQSLLMMVVSQVSAATGTNNHHLVEHRATFVKSLAHLEPDSSFGPARNIGAIKPQGMTWGEYHTLKIEIGICRGWDIMNYKAIDWSHFPGVEYILCIRLTSSFIVRQYKLFSVVNGAIEGCALENVHPIDIQDPTIIQLNSRRLLGLPPNIPIPVGFAQPNVELDLFPLVKRVMEEDN